jgi:hypothetical protein
MRETPAMKSIRPNVFDAYAKAPLSDHEWQCREEERERSVVYGPMIARRPMEQLLDGTWVPR